MTCIRFNGGIICVNPWGRLHLENRYVWVDFHEYLGPSFFWDSCMTKMYDPKDENDQIWPLFYAWYKKYQKAKEKREKARQSTTKTNAAIQAQKDGHDQS